MPPRSDSRLAVVTGEAAPELTDDGRAIAAALSDRGFETTPVVWTDESVDWTNYDVAVLRSCWNYPTDPDRFRGVLDAMATADVAVVNPPRVVRWNLHKSYLFDLQAGGVQIPATELVERGSEASLTGVLRERGLDEAVVKPAIGTASTDVWRTGLADAPADEGRFARLVADGDVLVQAFVPEIVDGERSIVCFGGAYSHAWNSPTEPDDVTAFGDADASYDPDDRIVEEAVDALETACDVAEVAPDELPYARVDYVERDGSLLLMELELIEPYLGLDRGGNTVERFCDAITGAIGRSG
jgi:glutathione synthase/RimK-type ligase-like ATP-grasp enzyme